MPFFVLKKKIAVHYLTLLVILLRSSLVHADDSTGPIVSQILSLCGACQLLVPGERHQQPESLSLFFDIVQQLIAQGERVLVGLEILTSQQSVLDAALKNQEIPPQLLHPIIDSRFYRNFLLALSRLQREAPLPIEIIAIDGKKDRDSTT